MLFIRDMLSLMRVTIRRASILILVVTAVLIAMWFTARHEVVAWMVHRAIYETPMPSAEYEVLEVRTDRVVLANFAIDGLFWADRIEIASSPRKLLSGRVGSVTVSGAVLQVALDEDGMLTGPALDWSKLLQDGTGESATAAAPPPFDSIIISNSTVDMTAPWGHLRLGLEGNVSNSLVALEGDGQWHAETSIGTAEGRFFLSVPHSGGSATVTAHVDDAELGYMETIAQGVMGTITLRGGETPDVQVELTAETLLHDHQVMEGLELNAQVADSGIAATLTLGSDTSPFSAALDVTVPSLSPGERAELSGWFTISEDLTLPIPGGFVVEAPARLSVDLAGAISAPLETFSLPELFRSLDLAGSVSLNGRGVHVVDRFDAGETALSLYIELQQSELLTMLDGPGFVHGLTIPVMAEVSEPLAALAGRTYDLTFADRDLRFGLNATPNGWAATPRLRAMLRSSDNLEGSVFVGGSAALGPSDSLETLSVSTLEIDLEGDLIPAMMTGSLRLAGQGSGKGGEFDGTFNAQARLETLSFREITASGVTIDLPGSLSLDEDKLEGALQPIALFGAETLQLGDLRVSDLLAEWPIAFSLSQDSIQIRLSDSGWIDLGALRLPHLVLNEATSIKLEPEHLPNLVIERPSNDISWDIRIQTAPADVALTLLDDAGQRIETVEGQIPRMGIRFGSLGISHLQGTMETSQGNLRLLDHGVRLADIKVLLSYNDGLSTWPQVSAEIRRIEDLNAPARFAPIVADANLAPVWPAGDDLRISGNLHMEDRRYLANVEASYEPGADRFLALIRMPPVKFERGGAQPVDVSPLYGALLEEAEGSFELLGDVGYANGKPTADFTLFIYDLSGRNGDVALEGLDGEVAFSGIAPWTTPPNQLLTAETLDIGVPLTDLALVFSLPGDDTVQIELGRAQFAGGSIMANPTHLRLGSDENHILLGVQGVDLATLLSYAEVSDLAIDASLSGSLPITISGKDIAIDKGRLESDKEGTLRYAPSGSDVPLDLDEGNLNLVLEALSDFRFSKLSLDINKPLGGSTELLLHIAGANPELYDGYPIELNVSVTGDLDRIARDSLAGWRISEELRERLSGF
jgi:hypothetical protein